MRNFIQAFFQATPPLKLTDLGPWWILDEDRIIGLAFECPHCNGGTNIAVQFANPPDGGAPNPPNENGFGDNGGLRWHRIGEIFEDITLSPSIDASKSGHWHGFLQGGVAR